MRNIHNTFVSEWMRETTTMGDQPSTLISRNNNQNRVLMRITKMGGLEDLGWGICRKFLLLRACLQQTYRFDFQLLILMKDLQSWFVRKCVFLCSWAFVATIYSEFTSLLLLTGQLNKLVNPRCELAASCLACVGPLLRIPAILMSNLEVPDKAL